MAYLYRHIRVDKNEPFYIGIGTTETYARAYTKGSRNNLWTSIVNKCGGIFKVEILYETDSNEEIIQKEIEFIKLYGRIDNKTGILANYTNGGDSIKGSSGINRGFTYKHTPENIQKIRERHLGKKRSKETCEKMSLAGKGRIQSKEHCLLKSKIFKGRVLSDEWKKKIGDSNRGKKLPQWQIDFLIAINTGRKLNAEQKIKNQQAVSKHILYVIDENRKITCISNSCSKLSEKIGISKFMIQKHVSGTRKKWNYNFDIVRLEKNDKLNEGLFVGGLWII